MFPRSFGEYVFLVLSRSFSSSYSPKNLHSTLTMHTPVHRETALCSSYVALKPPHYLYSPHIQRRTALFSSYTALKPPQDRYHSRVHTGTSLCSINVALKSQEYLDHPRVHRGTALCMSYI